MSVLIEGINVIARIAALEAKTLGGGREILEHPPNGTLCADRHLLRLGFIDPEEAEAWVATLEAAGLLLEGPHGFEDIAIVDQVHGLPLPCAWLELQGGPDQPTCAWLRGEPRGVLVVPEHWTFEQSLSRKFGGIGAAHAEAPRGFTPYEPVDHTADLAFVARGRTFEELFGNAARALLACIVDPATVHAREQERIELRGADREECLVAFLQELIYREEVSRMLYVDFSVLEAGPERVIAIARGESLDPARHELLTDVKAATYHDLRFEVESTPDGPLHRVRVVLDI